ncbi:hypothetical protein F5Y06DRAFT_273352 [Hypoxylon sp. FL0890]|nr:hypothetical protein F5Y06DRAFT_273352 [Hypoxylon sp. FL0890]
MSSSEIFWYCCSCLWGGPGGMPPELHPGCVSCGHPRCRECFQDIVQPTHLLYPELEITTGTKHNEALQISRAALLPAGNAAVDQSPSLPHTDVTRPSQNATGPVGVGVSGVSELEISEFSGDSECTPRSCQWDNFDPPDLVSTNDKDLFATGLFGTESSFNFEDTLVPQIDLSWDSYPINQDQWEADIEPNGEITATRHSLHQNTGSTNACVPFADGHDLQMKLGTDTNYAYTFEPQAPTLSFFGEINPVNSYQISGDSQHSTPWMSHASGSTPESLHPQDMPTIHAPTAQTVNPSYLLPKIEPLEYQSKAFSSSGSLPSFSELKDKDGEQIANERLISHADGKDEYAGPITKACESCLSATESDKAKPLACLFYKRNPELYSTCIYKAFKNISALRQHLDNDHKLGPYHCTNCWDSFSDKKLLETHANCQETGGIPVDQLPTISKTRDSPIKKWYWTWKKLFGERTPPLKCPHTHPIPDMKYHNLRQFSRYLAAKGTTFTISDINDAILKWVASNPEPSSTCQSMDICRISTPIHKALDINAFDI